MGIVRSAKQSVKIRSLIINSDDEVIFKIIHEILTLFKIEVLDENRSQNEMLVDYKTISIENNIVCSTSLEVTTSVMLSLEDGRTKKIVKQKNARVGERIPSETRRLIKLNLYDIFMDLTNAKSVPWGILHGVRPTKIVHKYIDKGIPMNEIITRLKNDYYVSEKKAELISHLAIKQRMFLYNNRKEKISIYVGIPFCLSKCLYCSFPSYVLPKNEILQQFLEALKKDILAAKNSIVKNNLKVENIYIGGGTPTSLPLSEFTYLIQLVKNSFFDTTTVEFTVEAGRPDSVDDDKIKVMMENGVNRVSVNPQTMQEKTLKHIGRKHTTQDIIDLFAKFRCAGMKNINMDVIIGLPGENVEDVEDTMKKIVALKPDNITIHALALKKGSVLKNTKNIYELPNDEITAKMFDVAMNYAEKLDMEPYYLYRQGYMSGNLENIGYSKKGSEGFYNIQIMEERQTILGIGPAATTKIVNFDNWSIETSFNAKDLTTYLQRVENYIEKRTNLVNDAFNE